MKTSVSREVQRLIVTGQICYICQAASATEPDGIGGKLCQECGAGLQAMRLHYDTAGGFRKAVKHTQV